MWLRGRRAVYRRYHSPETIVADKGSQNAQRQQEKNKKPEQHQHKEQEKWPVDEIEGES